MAVLKMKKEQNIIFLAGEMFQNNLYLISLKTPYRSSVLLSVLLIFNEGWPLPPLFFCKRFDFCQRYLVATDPDKPVVDFAYVVFSQKGFPAMGITALFNGG